MPLENQGRLNRPMDRSDRAPSRRCPMATRRSACAPQRCSCFETTTHHGCTGCGRTRTSEIRTPQPPLGCPNRTRPTPRSVWAHRLTSRRAHRPRRHGRACPTPKLGGKSARWDRWWNQATQCRWVADVQNPEVGHRQPQTTFPCRGARCQGHCTPQLGRRECCPIRSPLPTTGFKGSDHVKNDSPTSHP